MSSNLTNNRHQRPSPDPVLTASEIGNFEFCPVAWYLQRCGAARDPASVRDLEHGAREHRRIAIHAGRAKTLQRVQGLLLVAIIAIVAAVLVQLLGTGGLTGV